MAALAILPDPISIKTIYPEFTSTADSAIAFAIEQAAMWVDDTWMERDRIPAIVALSAHFMAVAGASAGVDGREVVSETIGPISVTYAQIAAAAASPQASNYGGTAYGKNYRSLLRRNHGHPMTIGGCGVVGSSMRRFRTGNI